MGVLRVEDMKKPELLAPAGSWEALVAAVENGADAVYLGGQMFNARQSAINFNESMLEQAVRYAHLHGVKVYVTVNVLISNQEINDAVRFLGRLQAFGVDAAIIQDAGLAYLAKRILPELPLHASTQMTAHNSPGVNELLEAGFSRIVLAREMRLEEIKKIKETTGAELEVFIHGALCFSYSGQCLLSSMIGGRSGNRGRCAQPCRLKYRLLDKQGKPVSEINNIGEYLLSSKDLNTSDILPGLIAAGIDSFKIEGRMKRPEYVATVVNIYRKLIDRASAISGEPYKVNKLERDNLAQIFNRGFTPGYFFGSQGREMMSFKRPNNRGLRLGRVKSIDHRKGLVEISLERTLNKGDGLEIWVTDGGRIGFTADEIFVNGKKVDKAGTGEIAVIPASGAVKPGDRVFKIFDTGLMRWARASFTTARGTGKKIPVVFNVQAGVDKPFSIKVHDNEGHVVEASTEILGQPAGNRPLDESFLSKQLGRLGNTPFELNSLTCKIEGKVIYPVSEINKVRRKALALMEDMILQERRTLPLKPEIFESRLKEFSNKVPAFGFKKENKGMLLSVSVGDMKSLEAAVDQGADIVYFEAGYLRSKPFAGKAELHRAFDICRNSGVRLIFHTPRITKDKDINKNIEMLQEVFFDGALAGNLGIMRVLLEEMPDVPLITDYGFNAFNRYTVEYLLKAGIEKVTLSPELTIGQVKELAEAYPVEVLVHGALELMVSEHCVIGSVNSEDDKKCSGPFCQSGGYRLKDRTGAFFPVESDRDCRMHLFNSRDLCLLDDLPELYHSGVSSVRIEARREDPGYVGETVKVYRRTIDSIRNGKVDIEYLEDARKKMLSLSPAGLTKGHFYRGV